MAVDRLPPTDFVRAFVGRAAAGGRGYVCVPNVQQCILAYDDPDFARIIQDADFVMSDSAVLHKFIASQHRLPPVEVLRGDKLTLAICEAAAREGVAIGLIGGKDEIVLDRMVTQLKLQVPGLAIAYAWSPPFRELTASEEASMLDAINASEARILFVGLGGPKQERWMARHAQRLRIMMIGVGAAFDWISGETKTSPDWVHSSGLEWLHRLISEPRRLWRRYLSTSPRFIWLYLTRNHRPKRER